ncbi:hypothetical protein [Tumebacillus flagellatus]|uniref:hypothetical protein n=1 Tax=Tumebacillus flagellatus TaxID=1157490 RepID=UPI0012680520|nr:hypothetical protein [Tumebacillus flagellatus]
MWLRNASGNLSVLQRAYARTTGGTPHAWLSHNEGYVQALQLAFASTADEASTPGSTQAIGIRHALQPILANIQRALSPANSGNNTVIGGLRPLQLSLSSTAGASKSRTAGSTSTFADPQPLQLVLPATQGTAAPSWTATPTSTEASPSPLIRQPIRDTRLSILHRLQTQGKGILFERIRDRYLTQVEEVPLVVPIHHRQELDIDPEAVVRLDYRHPEPATREPEPASAAQSVMTSPAVTMEQTGPRPAELDAADIDRLVDRVYRELQKRLQFERSIRGL